VVIGKKGVGLTTLLHNYTNNYFHFTNYNKIKYKIKKKFKKNSQKEEIVNRVYNIYSFINKNYKETIIRSNLLNHKEESRKFGFKISIDNIFPSLNFIFEIKRRKVICKSDFNLKLSRKPEVIISLIIEILKNFKNQGFLIKLSHRVGNFQFASLQKKRKVGYLDTIGFDVYVKNIVIGNLNCKIHLWRLSNNSNFKQLLPMYISGASAAIIIYDLTENSSLAEISDWIQLLRKKRGKIPIMLLGNKVDDINNLKFHEKDIKEFLQEYMIDLHYEVSGLGKTNLDIAFKNLTSLLINKKNEFKEAR
jgi:GTPase SAR1 family protein